MPKKPIVCIPCNQVDLDGTKGQAVRDTYIRALVEVADCHPLLLPSLPNGIAPEDLLDRVDGFLLNGAYSHISPSLYDCPQEFDDKHIDTARDKTVLPLLAQAIARDKPVIAICRGFQELNIALGGTLNQRLHETEGYLDHRGNPDLKPPALFEHQAHKVTRQNGGWFEKIGLPSEFTVNSIHEQGIDQLGQGLFVEAIAEDGLIEAVSLPGKKFILGVQWHPEGDWRLNETSRRLFTAFGTALRESCSTPKEENSSCLTNCSTT